MPGLYPGGVEQDSLKARIAQLSFKKATAGGLTPAEEWELADLMQKLALQNAAAGQNS